MQFLDQCFAKQTPPNEFNEIVTSKLITINENILHLQHLSLVDAISSLYEAVSRLQIESMTPGDNELIKTLLKRLRAFAKVHFKTEELFLHDLGFKKLKKHKKIHKKFRKAINSYQSQLDNDPLNPKIPTEILFSTTHWLLTHVNREDKKYNDTLPKK